VSDTTQSITVGDNDCPFGASLPDLTSGFYLLTRVDSEQMAVTGVTLSGDDTATLSVVRGANGTTAAPHSSGASVFLASDQRGFSRGSGFNIGTFLNPGDPPSLVVDTALDKAIDTDGLTSLREAIAYANLHPGPDTIVLAATVVGSRQRTVRLTGGPLVLTDPATTTIVGPGAKRLTIRGAGRSRVFDVHGGSLAFSGLTIADGRADNGAGIRNEGGRLALTRVVLRGNMARFLGGGLSNDGTATLSGVTITGNAASLGGGIANLGRLSVGKVTIRGNVARYAGELFNRGKLTRAPAGPRVVPASASPRSDAV
jgi:hypothetical protein